MRTETSLVNYTINNIEWTCHMATHSLAVATDVAHDLRTAGYRVNVQSILIDEDGRVKL